MILEFILTNWPTLVLLSSYPIGASIHIIIAYRGIKKEAARTRAEYEGWLKETVLPAFKTEILEGVKALLPDGDGVADAVEARMKQVTASAAGAAARTAQSGIERAISGSIQFGNPMLDGLWALVPPELKRTFFSRVAKQVRLAGPEGLAQMAGPEEPKDGLGPEWH
jgi:hypothetical protein